MQIKLKIKLKNIFYIPTITKRTSQTGYIFLGIFKTKLLKEDKRSVDAFNAGRAIGKEEICHRGKEKVAELLKDIE